MAHFLDNYEDVNSRIKRFRETIKNPRIITDIVNFQPENGWVLARADIYVNDVLVATDFAFGDKLTYPTNMQKWYVEDTITSAIGRAISLVINVDHKATKQNMARVENPVIRETAKVENPDDPWTTIEKPAPTKMTGDDFVNEVIKTFGGELIPQCAHGPMALKEGEKNGRQFHGYVCTGPKPLDGNGTKQCPAIWYDLSPSGKWTPPKPKN